MSANLGTAASSGELDYATLTDGSRVALGAARTRLAGGHSRQTLLYPPHPVFGVRGRGARIEDVDGRTYLDLVNNYTSLIHGHAHAPTTAAMIAQLQRGTALGAPTTDELVLARELSARIPSMQRIRFTVTGSEAVLFALRVARAVTGRPRILKFEGGFHGNVDEVQQSIQSPALQAGEFSAPAPNSEGLARVGTVIARLGDRESVTRALSAHDGEIAAIVVEPFLGNNALIQATPDFLQWLTETAHSHGALVVLDEVQSCRLARGGAQSIRGVTPDLTALGKTIGGGLPLAAFGGSEDLMSVMDGMAPRVPQPGTFNAFSLSLAAAIATLEHWDEQQIKQLNDTGAQVRAGIADVFAAGDIPATVTGEGSMFHIALREDPIQAYEDVQDVDADGWRFIHHQLLARGIYLTARGTGCLSTPMGSDEVDEFLTRLGEAVGVLRAQRTRPA
jgi:glutamate-1-semialdehyde 2,1-aminomutase